MKEIVQINELIISINKDIERKNKILNQNYLKDIFTKFIFLIPSYLIIIAFFFLTHNIAPLLGFNMLMDIITLITLGTATYIIAKKLNNIIKTKKELALLNTKLNEAISKKKNIEQEISIKLNNCKTTKSHKRIECVTVNNVNNKPKSKKRKKNRMNTR